MNNEDKAVQTDQDAATGQEVENTSKEEESKQDTSTEKVEETTEAPAVEDEVDYKSLLEEEKKKKEKAENALVREKTKHRKPKEDDDSEDTDEPNPVEERLERIESAIGSQGVNSLISQLSQNPDEQALIQYHYENSIQKSGLSIEAIRTDLEKSQALANAGRIQRENKELKTAQRNSGKSNLFIGGGGAEEKKSETSPISPELTKQLTKRAMDLGQDPKKYIELYIRNSRTKSTT
jgi:hypothetical protein